MGEPQPNWHAYYELEERGMLLALGAWADSQLIGYAVAFVIDELHYDVTVCQHDVIYVKPEWRHAGVGPYLMDELEELAQAHGAKAMLMHAKPGTALERVLPRRGYKHEETVFRKELACPQQ